MKRQNIIIDGITYIIDLYDAVEDLKDNMHTSKFVMLRNGNFANDIFSETDVFIIEKSIIESCTNDDVIDFDELNNIIVFPVDASSHILYSKNYKDFNPDFNSYNFKIGNMIELIYEDKDGMTEADIPCDIVRIYGPTIKNFIDTIIDVEVFINDIKFHLLCRKSNYLETNSSTEFKIGNFAYSEYIEMYMPNINLLFEKNKYYFKDIYNISGFKKKSIFSIVKTENTVSEVNTLDCKLDYRNGVLTNSTKYNIKIPDKLLKKLKKFKVEQDINETIANAQNNNTDEFINSEFTTENKRERIKLLNNNDEFINAEFTTENKNERIKLLNHNDKYITIYVEKQPSAIETTSKYIFSKKTIMTKNVFNGNITIIQGFAIDETGEIKSTVSIIVSSLIMWEKYFIGFVKSNVITQIIENPNSIVETCVVDNDIDYIGIYKINSNQQFIITPRFTEVALVNFDSSEIKIDNDKLYCSMHLLEMPFFIEQSESLELAKTKESSSISITEVIKKTDEPGAKLPLNCKTYYEPENQLFDVIDPQLKFILYPSSSTNEQNGYYVPDNTMNLDIFSKNYHIIMENTFKFVDSGNLVISTRFKYPEKYSSVNEAYLDIYNQSIYNYSNDIEDISEYDEEIIPEQINKCGFNIEISTDRKFKNIVYNDIINIDVSEGVVIDDMNYTISNSNLNVNWNSYPDILIVRVRYYDRYSFTIIEGNHIVITKEIFKYTLNDNASARIDINTLKENDMYFIDKINCSIIKNEISSSSVISEGTKNNARILYKPIFYKAKDLEQIKLKSGITQNIGINLSSLLSKVDTFKIVIDGAEYTEIGRNDAYVIFRINTLEFKTNSGQYNLLDQNDEYISDGTWYLY